MYEKQGSDTDFDCPHQFWVFKYIPFDGMHQVDLMTKKQMRQYERHQRVSEKYNNKARRNEPDVYFFESIKLIGKFIFQI